MKKMIKIIKKRLINMLKIICIREIDNVILLNEILNDTIIFFYDESVHFNDSWS